ncbi:hypothetical protein FNV43_RR07752 [Rhamnella rubrinervis]|uniref:S-locus receptor kinase C-terminal domain-containing protein n=1 Tax=Rhamnella rubrinervis TaxID=2594499 RepID=A0A8K0MMG5_9ROSA|nr:hypothetical protein FNV43_RR07752 [Rhamnella rubrinervis]
MIVEWYPVDEVLKCMHIGLLCVQQDPMERPNMPSVVVQRGSSGSITLPEPRQPAFVTARVIQMGSLFNYNPNPFRKC